MRFISESHDLRWLGRRGKLLLADWFGLCLLRAHVRPVARGGLVGVTAGTDHGAQGSSRDPDIDGLALRGLRSRLLRSRHELDAPRRLPIDAARRVVGEVDARRSCLAVLAVQAGEDVAHERGASALASEELQRALGDPSAGALDAEPMARGELAE